MLSLYGNHRSFWQILLSANLIYNGILLVSIAVMSLVPHVEGGTRTTHFTRNRRAQTLSIQRQQNSSPPPNATVDTKETLDVPDHSMLPVLTRNQPSRKSKSVSNFTDRLIDYFTFRCKETASELVKKVLEKKCWE